MGNMKYMDAVFNSNEWIIPSVAEEFYERYLSFGYCSAIPQGIFLLSMP